MGFVHDCGRAWTFEDWHNMLRVRQNTLGFVNEEALSVHGNVRTSSIFISQSGEWRLGGLEVLSSMKEDDAVIYVSFSSPIWVSDGDLPLPRPMPAWCQA